MKSIYQTNGKPLSPQALYQQKLKQGIYNSPNVANVGVNSNASDTAALLAASTDLTVKPSYERTIAPEAHDAALAAKLDKVYQWSTGVHDEAASAANSSLYGGAHDSNGTMSSKTSIGNGTGIGSYSSSALYAAANKNSTSTMTSRMTPEKNYKHGLVPNSSALPYDINKLSSVANANSTKTMDSRINPSLDVGRSGLTRNENRAKSFQAKDISGQYLLSAANALANDRLNSLAYSKPEDFKAQAQLYANALAIAQQKSNERLANNKAGVIDLGGGLTVTQAELNKMASLIVEPVLADLDTKASQQRGLDKAKEAKRQEAYKAHDAAKRAEWEEKAKEKEALEKAKKERVEANDKEKQSKEEEFSAYQIEENKKIEAKLEELKIQQEEHGAKKGELLTQKQENQDKIDAEEQELISTRKTELETMQQERDVEIEPILSELKVENGKLKELTDAKTELTTEVDNLTSQNDEYTAKLKELEEKLAQTETEIESTTKELETAESKLNDTNKEVEDLTASTGKEHEEIDQETSKLDKEIEDLETQKQQHLSSKAAQKDEIKSKLKQRVEDEHKINSELPEHLRSTVDEKKLTDASSIFSDEVAPEPIKPEVVTDEPKPPKVVSKPVEKKKSSPIKRLSNIFKRKSVSGASAVVSAPKQVSKATLDVPVKKSVESSKTSHSEEVYEDDISIQNNNKGGLFKEEI